MSLDDNLLSFLDDLDPLFEITTDCRDNNEDRWLPPASPYPNIRTPKVFLEENWQPPTPAAPRPFSPEVFDFFTNDDAWKCPEVEEKENDSNVEEQKKSPAESVPVLPSPPFLPSNEQQQQQQQTGAIGSTADESCSPVAASLPLPTAAEPDKEKISTGESKKKKETDHRETERESKISEPFCEESKENNEILSTPTAVASEANRSEVERKKKKPLPTVTVSALEKKPERLQQGPSVDRNELKKRNEKRKKASGCGETEVIEAKKTHLEKTGPEQPEKKKKKKKKREKLRVSENTEKRTVNDDDDEKRKKMKLEKVLESENTEKRTVNDDEKRKKMKLEKRLESKKEDKKGPVSEKVEKNNERPDSKKEDKKRPVFEKVKNNNNIPDSKKENKKGQVSEKAEKNNERLDSKKEDRKGTVSEKNNERKMKTLHLVAETEKPKQLKTFEANKTDVIFKIPAPPPKKPVPRTAVFTAAVTSPAVAPALRKLGPARPVPIWGSPSNFFLKEFKIPKISKTNLPSPDTCQISQQQEQKKKPQDIMPALKTRRISQQQQQPEQKKKSPDMMLALKTPPISQQQQLEQKKKSPDMMPVLKTPPISQKNTVPDTACKQRDVLQKLENILPKKKKKFFLEKPQTKIPKTATKSVLKKTVPKPLDFWHENDVLILHLEPEEYREFYETEFLMYKQIKMLKLDY